MNQTLLDMPLWIGFAIMTAAVIWFVLRPLAGNKQPVRSDAELAIYRDQLGELEREAGRGIIQAAEAEAARLEISRRILAADAASERENLDTIQASKTLRKSIALGLAIAIPVLTLGLYVVFGSPDLGGQPFAARMARPLEELPFEALVLRVEQQVKANPDDIKGRELLASTYMKQGRFGEASIQWARLMQLDGVTAGRMAAKSEADLLQADGIMNAGIRAGFEKAASLDPHEARAQYYLGMAELEDGDKTAAITRWKTMLDSAPKDAEWRPRVEAMLAEVEKPASSAPGPDAADIEAASGMSAEDRALMVEGMVARLANRLDQNPDDLDGWIRLIKAYGVMGKGREQAAARDRARRIFAADKKALAQIDAAGP